MSEEFEFDDVDFDQPIEDAEVGESQRKRKKRVRNWTAEDRAKHRVFERSRREAFNERLNELAGLLPSLQGAKDTQLSKHVIVDESVKHHHAQQATIEELSRTLNELKSQHERLQAEVEAWRQAACPSQLGADGLSTSEVTAMPNGQQTASLQPQQEFDRHPEVSAHLAEPSAALELQQYAAKSGPRAAFPELGTYPGSLVQLPPDLTSAEVDPALNAFNGQASLLEMSENEQSLHNLQGSTIPSSNAMFQDPRLQRLFGRFQEGAAGSDDHSASEQYASAQNQLQDIFPNSSSNAMELQEFWPTQWPTNDSRNWQSNYSETDFNAVQFRNDTSIMNI